ncbi:hypothetical protein KKF32_00660 [Patescibacteria group bacterium]|nr:hypothetical protein [Patescibacteria group bacterium]
MKKFFIFLVFALALGFPLMGLTEEAVTSTTDANTEVTADDIGLSETQLNNAAEEATEAESFTGTLVEIGNTTAENTTIIIRTQEEDGTTEDQTVEIEKDTSVQNDSYQASDLSDWIAGDQVTVSATEYTNSGAVVANKLRNRSMSWNHKGRNGWITAIRLEENEMDVQWNNQTFTLDTSEARMVAGIKNPASLADFEVGDRIRSRVVDDGDGNPATWKAKIIVVLRRGGALFMRVTRWVVPAKITMIPEDLTLPVTIEVEVLPSKFYEEGDVNNLIGAPSTKLMVDITEETKLRRRFLGKALLKEFSEGDNVRIIGRRDENTGHLVAKFIKNNSIQRLGVAQRLGKVTAIDTATRVLNTELLKTLLVNKDVTVNVLEKAKILKGGNEVNFEEIKVNDVIRVRGTANRIQRSVDADVLNLVGQAY